MTLSKKLWIALVVLVVLTPLGLLLPAWLGAGSAWGEWSAEELRARLGFVPRGLARLSGLWRAPLPDYGTPAHQESVLGYVLSAVIGVAAVVALAFVIGRLLARKRPDDP